MPETYPAYLDLYRSGELARRVEAALARLSDCVGCPRRCHADRCSTNPASFCKTGRHARVSSCFPHHGEENCLRGWNGSGTIFFAHCNLGCVFCQNYEVSHLGEGREVLPGELAAMMVSLEHRGCHNVNFVTPSHVAAQILEALPAAIDEGLRLPLVYNTGSYDSVETLRSLRGVVDIYMPDFKFWDERVAQELAGAADYPEVARAALREMHEQVGDLEIGAEGLARRGLLVRHLVMPNGQAGTRQVMRFLAQEISANTYVNIMPQYRPAGTARRHESIRRGVTFKEYEEALKIAREEGIQRLDVR